jgi:chromosome segregation ATPase
MDFLDDAPAADSSTETLPQNPTLDGYTSLPASGESSDFLANYSQLPEPSDLSPPPPSSSSSSPQVASPSACDDNDLLSLPQSSLPLTSALSISLQNIKPVNTRKSFKQSTSFLLPDDTDPTDGTENLAADDPFSSDAYNPSIALLDPTDALETILHSLSGESEVIYDSLSSFIQNLTSMKYKQEKLFSHTFRTLRYTQQTLSTFQGQNSQLSEEIQLLTSKNSELMNTITQNDERHQFQEKKIGELQEMCQKLLSEKDNLVVVLESLNSTVSEERSKELELELTIQQKEKEIAQNLNDKMLLEQKFHELELAHQTTEQNQQSLQTEVIRLMDSLQQKERDMQESQQRFHETNEELRVTRSEKESVMKFAEETQEENLQLRQMVARYEENLVILEKDTEARIQAQREETLQASQAKEEEYQTSLRQLQKRYDDLLSEQHTATATHTASTQQLATDNTKLKNLISEYQHRMKAGGEELKRIKAELQTLETLREEDAKKSQIEISELKQKNLELNEIFRQLTMKYNELVTGESLREEKAMSDTKIGNLLQTNENLENEILQLKKFIEQKKFENLEMSEAVSQKSLEMDQLVSRNSDLKGNLEKLKKEYEKVTSEEDQLTKELINTKLGLALAAEEVDMEHNTVTKLKRVLSKGGNGPAGAGAGQVS